MPSVTFTNGQLLSASGIFASSLRIERGSIAAFDAPPGKKDAVFDLGGSLVLPGLINAHDHLELNNFPRLKWRERYANAREWIADFQPRFETDPALASAKDVPLNDRLLIGAVKNLLSGVTTVCHHNPLHPYLRRNYPIRVVTRFRYSHSLVIDGEKAAAAYRRTPNDWPWIIHAAEGTDDEAAAELTRLEMRGCLGSNTVLVHGVGLTAADRAKLLARGGALIWCPSSNFFTLSATADIRELACAGRVALGSDSRLSGGRDLLEELTTAAATQQVGPAKLFRMVTTDAARILRLNGAGEIREGAPADLVVLPPPPADPFADVIATERSRVRLVMIDGEPRVGDDDLTDIFAATGTRFERVRLDGRPKLLARWIAQRLRKSHVAEKGLEL